MVPVAIVGLAALMPGARDVAEFWRNIVTGRDLITDVPATHWSPDDFYDPDPAAPDKTYCRRGAFLPDIDFDPLAHGLPPTTLPALDPGQLLGLVVADQLLADLDEGLAGPLDRERVSVIIGSSTLSRVGMMDARIQRPVWRKALRERGIDASTAEAVCDRIAAHYVPWQEATFPGLLSNVVAGRIANRLDLHGTNCTVDAACASSLAAVAAGVNELSLGQADLVITGGVDATNNPLMYVCFSKTPALSPTGDVRPFAEDADGTMLGEGLAMLALKRLDVAERDGDRIYAVIRGIGSSSDGRGGAIYAPMPQGQVLALRRAYEAAGYGPDTVELVEAHGTATNAGDAAEFESLRRVFGESGRQDTQWCALGTVKSQIGHTKAAAGAAGLVKAVLALHQRVLPPTIKVRQPNSKLGVDRSPFYLNTIARPWVRAGDYKRRASVSSFGFGGANFHVTLEEHGSDVKPRSRTGAPREAAANDIAFLFPGQGAQYVGMGADVGRARPVWNPGGRGRGPGAQAARRRPPVVQRTAEPVALQQLGGLAGHTEPKPVASLGGMPLGYASLLACAWGRPTEGLGPMAEPFLGPRRPPRLPGPPYHFMSRITAVSGPYQGMAAGSTVDAEYDVPAEAWYFADNGGTMPVAVLMEIALQPCGWLGCYVGSPVQLDTELLFRNLDGDVRVFREVGPETGIVRTRARLETVSHINSMIIETFAIECFAGDALILRGTTVFGYFTTAAFADQPGLPPTPAERSRLAEPSPPPPPPPRVAGPMLTMIDRITGYWPSGGPAGLGRIRAEKDVDPADWYFKAHFFQDPAMPGSLGVEAMCQLLRWYLLTTGAGHTEIALDEPLTWTYRGQITPTDRLITIELDVLEVRDTTTFATAWLWIDGRRIYRLDRFGLRAVPGRGLA